MKVAVSGATGFLGRPLIEALLSSGHEVRALVRKPGKIESAFARPIEARAFDGVSPGEGPWLDGCDAVVSLAGEPVGQRWTPEARKRIQESRVNGTRALAKDAARAGVKTFVSASGIGIYGTKQEGPLTESSAHGDDFLASVCRKWEEAAKVPGSTARTVFLRIGVVLHPDGGALKELLPAFRLGAGGKMGNGAQVMSWIHRADAVSLILHALETPSLSGPLNVTAPNPATNAELARTLGKVISRPTIFAIPGFALKTLFGEMSMVVLEGQRVLPAKAEASGFRFAFPELEPALRNLLR